MIAVRTVVVTGIAGLIAARMITITASMSFSQGAYQTFFYGDWQALKIIKQVLLPDIHA